MTSNKQVLANKKNSKKGGVKTEQGKEISKLNSLKHGLNANVYDIDFENKILTEYAVEGSLEKLLVKNIAISKSRYERGVTLEYELLKNIIDPSRYEKVYKSQEDYEDYVQQKEYTNNAFDNLNVFMPQEPEYTYDKIEGGSFEYDLEKIQYLIEVIGKYNYQNEIRLNKNITSLLQFIDK